MKRRISSLRFVSALSLLVLGVPAISTVFTEYSIINNNKMRTSLRLPDPSLVERLKRKNNGEAYNIITATPPYDTQFSYNSNHNPGFEYFSRLDAASFRDQSGIAVRKCHTGDPAYLPSPHISTSRAAPPDLSRPIAAVPNAAAAQPYISVDPCMATYGPVAFAWEYRAFLDSDADGKVDKVQIRKQSRCNNDDNEWCWTLSRAYKPLDVADFRREVYEKRELKDFYWPFPLLATIEHIAQERIETQQRYTQTLEKYVSQSLASSQ